MKSICGAEFILLGDSQKTKETSLDTDIKLASVPSNITRSRV